MTEQRQEEEFEAFLDGKSELAKSYRKLGREEPPPDVDARILAEAREAARIHRAEFGPRGGWLKPVALAATVLLSFSLVMNIVIDSPTRFEQAETEAKGDDIGRTIERSAAAPRIAEDWQKASRERSERVDEESAFAARKRPAIVPPSLADRSAEVQVDLSSEAPFDAPPTLPEIQAEIRSEVGESAMRVIDRAAALAIVAEYVAASDGGRVDADAPAGNLAQQPGEGAIESVLPATAEPVAGSATVTVDAEAGVEDKGDDPEALLREIRRLHAAGDAVEAGVLLDEFLARYPDHPVSVNIRRLGY